MRVETIVCDKCGKPVAGDPFSVQISTAGKTQEGGMYAELGDKEFCEKCAARVFAILMGKDKEREKAKNIPKEAKDNSVPDSQKEGASKPRKKLDKGKMIALKNAGWSNQQIAEELGTTEGCIATYISQIRKKQVKDNG